MLKIVLADHEKVNDHLTAFSARLAPPMPQGLMNIIHATLAAEDRRYFQHRGIDYFGLIRAALRFISGGRLEGASTIEQQLVRTIRGRYEVTAQRKATECLLAAMLSRSYPKGTIVLAYLDIAYFGWKANGLHEAANRLGIEVATASKEEAAALAAMLKIPMPRAPSEKYISRHSFRVAHILRNWDKVKTYNGYPLEMD